MAEGLKYPANATQALLTLTRPKDHLWVIELHNGQDNRLTTTLINGAIKPALDEVERQWREKWRAAQAAKKQEEGKGALMIVGRRDQDKFFSNGLDFANAVNDMNFFPVTFDPMLVRLLTFPIPTIAAINGHCYAGGMMLSLACDYRVMTDASKRNAWLCMNEIALEGHRYSPVEALKDGILDAIVDGKTADILAAAEKIADRISTNASAGVWGLIKNHLYRDTLQAIVAETRTTDARIEDAAARARLD
ncbi:ClpP/crotonase-like domain-containing protein [Coprinopsis sp. MPI-PUGE-AT-0042]|nr:ClpP/crotonase-like domain-containing protein [Coprinopsis sp. MPI-PUGE-AT-0042]